MRNRPRRSAVMVILYDVARLLFRRCWAAERVPCAYAEQCRSILVSMHSGVRLDMQRCCVICRIRVSGMSFRIRHHAWVGEIWILSSYGGMRCCTLYLSNLEFTSRGWFLVLL